MIIDGIEKKWIEKNMNWKKKKLNCNELEEWNWPQLCMREYIRNISADYNMIFHTQVSLCYTIPQIITFIYY